MNAAAMYAPKLTPQRVAWLQSLTVGDTVSVVTVIAKGSKPRLKSERGMVSNVTDSTISVNKDRSTRLFPLANGLQAPLSDPLKAVYICPPESLSPYEAVTKLIEYILHYESDTFSPSVSNMDETKAEAIAALLIEQLMDDLDGVTLTAYSNQLDNQD